jgi:hypothetical protein
MLKIRTSASRATVGSTPAPETETRTGVAIRRKVGRCAMLIFNGGPGIVCVAPSHRPPRFRLLNRKAKERIALDGRTNDWSGWDGKSHERNASAAGRSAKIT